MEEQNKKDRLKGIIGTLGFHLLLLLCFIFFGLHTPLPLPEEEGVEIRLGTLDGMGDITFTPPPRHIPATPSTPPNEVKEEMITQNTDDTPAIERVDRIKQPERTTKPEVVQKETDVKNEDKKPEPVVDNRFIFPGSSQTGSNQGETNKPGYQGSTTGNPNASSHQGGTGNGISFSLTGRSSKFLPRPDYNTPEQGTVVVTIYVDRSGKVTRAVPGAQGTTTTDQALRQLATQAALRSTFDANPNAPEEQTGTITYRFIRLN